MLSVGFVPVLHGDCVLDSIRGCTILSGDTIIKVGYCHLRRFATLVKKKYLVLIGEKCFCTD